jgi:hypothetical protein
MSRISLSGLGDKTHENTERWTVRKTGAGDLVRQTE